MSTNVEIANCDLSLNKALMISQLLLALYVMGMLIVFFVRFLSCLKGQGFTPLIPGGRGKEGLILKGWGEK